MHLIVTRFHGNETYRFASLRNNRHVYDSEPVMTPFWRFIDHDSRMWIGNFNERVAFLPSRPNGKNEEEKEEAAVLFRTLRDYVRCAIEPRTCHTWSTNDRINDIGAIDDLGGRGRQGTILHTAAIYAPSSRDRWNIFASESIYWHLCELTNRHRRFI